MQPWLMTENEEDKCLHLRETTGQKEGLNCVVVHNLLHFSSRNLICSLSCAIQLLFLSLSFSCGPGHFWAGICHVRWIESFALFTKEGHASAHHCSGLTPVGNALFYHLVPVLERRRPSFRLSPELILSWFCFSTSDQCLARMHKLRGGSEGSTQCQAIQVHSTCLFALSTDSNISFSSFSPCCNFFPVCFGSWKISTPLICFSPQTHQNVFIP